jgi:FkbM family methyltransferase
MSVIFFKQQHPQAVVIAFEPDADLFAALKANVGAFGLANVELHQSAVWFHNDLLYFAPEGGHSGRVTHPGDEAAVSIKAVRLRDWLAEPIDFLKIDVEGAELDLLVDCNPLLGNVDKLFVEYHSRFDEPQRLHELLQLLVEAGFRYDIKEEFGAKHPFLKLESQAGFDLQLAISCYRPEIRK